MFNLTLSVLSEEVRGGGNFDEAGLVASVLLLRNVSISVIE